MKQYLFIFISLLILSSCSKEQYIFEVNEIPIVPANTDKTKQKSEELYISILYANMFQIAMSPSQLVEVQKVINSIGDKQVAYETIVSKFMNDPSIQIPDDSFMRADIDQFIIDTYKRFYVRFPTEAEKTFFRNFIETRPNLSAELVYFAFAISNEYYYY